jgi:hypothetical protein
MLSRCVFVIRGINIPLSVAAISNLADALGVVVPMPVCAFEYQQQLIMLKIEIHFFIEKYFINFQR